MKKQGFVIIVLILMFVFTGTAQGASGSTWSYELSVPDQYVWFKDTIPVSTGGYVAVGKAWDSDAGDSTAQNAYICRLDKDKQVLWSKNITYEGAWYDELNSVVETSDGGFMATGNILLDGVTEQGTATTISALMVVKVDANGTFVWSRLFKNFANHSTLGNRIKAAQGGNYVIVGEKIAYTYDEVAKVYKYVTLAGFIAEVDTNGQVVMSKTHYGDYDYSYEWRFNDVVQDSYGAYYTVGYAATRPYTPASGSVGMLLVKMDNDGNVLWSKKIDYAQDGNATGSLDMGRRLLLSGDTIYITGISSPTFTLTSVSTEGIYNWTKQYFSDKSVDTGITEIPDFITTSDGNLVVLTSGGHQSITKIDTSGSVMWSKNILETSGQPTSIDEATDGTLVVSGWGTSYEKGTISFLNTHSNLGKTCEDTADLDFTVQDITMVSSSISNRSALLTAAEDSVPLYNGPTLTSENYCGLETVCSTPGKVGLVSPSATLGDTAPIFTWQADNCATWYKLYIENTTTGEIIRQWYEVVNNSEESPDVSQSGDQCSVTFGSALAGGSYVWHILPWNESGKGTWSDGMNFTVESTIPGKVTHTSPSGTIQDAMPTYTWVHDTNATWYKFWIGYPNGERVFAQWYDAADICSEGNCSATPDSGLSNKSYEWYVKSWSESGKVWSNGMPFTVTGVDASCTDVSGAYYFIWSSDASNCGEGIEDFSGSGSISQNGCQISVSAHGKTLNGTLSGNKITGSGNFAEDGGTTYYSVDLTFSGDTVSGLETWTWSGQGFSCSGTDTIQGTKN